MKPEAQRIAIAKACGWKLTRTEEGGVLNHPNGYAAEFTPWDWAYTHAMRTIPDYLNDLNAMAEAEATIKQPGLGTWCEYARQLIRICGISIHSEIHATAAQRAEAFLRTLNLWTESQ